PSGGISLRPKQTKSGRRGQSDKDSPGWPNSYRNDSNSYASALKGQAQVENAESNQSIYIGS
ncbi:hypothetical protein Tco_1000510, partial [Tanacetum coccineum]